MDEELSELTRLGRQRPGFIAGQDAAASEHFGPNAPSAQPPGGVRSLWWFPPVVNDRAARTTAMLVVALALATVVLSWAGLDVAALVAGSLLLAGFVLRGLAGPRFDPFGQLSVRWLAPRVFGEPVMVGGAPKRFAQLIGLVFSAVALGLRVAGVTGASDVVLLLLVVAAALEGFLGICLGCLLFARLQGWGVVRDDIRADCAVPAPR